jgi:excisionase family DNA binding protein
MATDEITDQPAPDADKSEVMSADEVARMLGLNRKTVYEAASRGILPCRRIGRRCLFFRPAIVAWLRTEGRAGRAA